MASNFLDDEKLQELLRISQKNPDLLKKEYERLLNQAKPVSSKEYLSPKFEMQLDPEGGIVIEPDMSFVIKSRDSKTKEKFFINVVTHPIIDEPEEKNFVDYNNEKGIRLPMSLGSLKEDFDKNKSICKVVDCVLNPKITATIQKTNDAMLFFYQLVGTYIQQKYKIELEEEFTLPKMKYKGTSIEFQRVKGKKAPKIETLDSQDTESADANHQAEEALKSTVHASSTAQIDWKLFLEYDDGQTEEFDGIVENLDLVRKIIFELELPLLVTGRNINLRASEDEIEMTAGKIYRILFKPIILVDPNSVKAKFDTKNRRLVIQLDKLKRIAQKEGQEDNTANQAESKTIKAPELSNELLYDLL